MDWGICFAYLEIVPQTWVLEHMGFFPRIVRSDAHAAASFIQQVDGLAAQEERANR